MLEKFDLSKKISKPNYKTLHSELEQKLGELQREAKELKIPIIILFEGWDAAGKGTLINRLTLSLDPRGFKVFPIHAPNEEERLRPFLWRFWTKIPERGRIAIFDRSWCGRILEERINKTVKKNIWLKAFDEILSFERQLINDGYLIIKFFLHIDKKEQKKRFKNLVSNPSTKWTVTKEDWKHHDQYNDYIEAYEQMLAKTHSVASPWTIVESHNRRYSTIKIFKTTIDMIEHKIAEMKLAQKPSRVKKKSTIQLPELSNSILDRSDLSLSLNRDEYERALKKHQERIREIEHEIYANRLPVIMAFEGWDAAGKGGSIKRLVQRMDPRGYEVVTTAAPNEIEQMHHYLWRFWKNIPKAGHVVIFDRSWYGRVLVEKIEGFCTEEEWKRAYSEINEMEEQWANFGTVIMKFWVHISSDEQLKRFELRQKTKHKQWKITDEDWRNREKWESYKAAVDEMLYRTSTSYAPWTIIEANSKLFARIKTLKTVIDALEKHL